MPAAPHHQRAVATSTGYCPLKERSRSDIALSSTARLRFCAGGSSRQTSAPSWMRARGDAAIALAGCARYRSRTPARAAARSRVFGSCARDACSRLSLASGRAAKAMASVGLLGLPRQLWVVLCTCCAREALRQRVRRPHRRDRCLRSISGYAVGADLRLVCIVVNGVCISGGRGGRARCCGGGCGSLGKISRPTEVTRRSFVFGPTGAATRLK